MLFMDVLIQRPVMKCTMTPVVPGIFHNEEDADLKYNLPDWWEWGSILDAEIGRDRVKEPDLWQFSGEMAHKNQHGAVPLFLEGWHFLGLDLVLVEVWDHVEDHEWDASAEIKHFVKDKGQDTGCVRVVLYEEIPCLANLSTEEKRNKGFGVAYCPKTFEVRKLTVISADLH